jgi:hypothetical protein
MPYRRIGQGAQAGATRMTEMVILLDRKTKALRSGNRWCIQRLKSDGSWDMTDSWDGGRRSLFHWAEKNDVHPTREAEAILNTIAEFTGFRDR